MIAAGSRIAGPVIFFVLLLESAPAGARLPLLEPYDGAVDREAVIGLDPGYPGGFRALADTVWFGGSGLGNGTVVRGGTWNWEADSGEAPEYFPDGDPVGNEYRDGWIFADRTTRGGGPSSIGAGHWRPDGTYDFDFDGGAFAHRAATHANDGVNDGPDPLAGGWSLWIGTNLYLNPEHCGWGGTAGYGDGWSQGIVKRYRFRNTPGPGEYPLPPANAALSLAFFHRYAVEADYDTCWVEISTDGVAWEQVGDGASGNGMWSGGSLVQPLPGPFGGPATAALRTWPGGEGDLWVRLRLASDLYFSDESEGGSFFYGWQIDDLSLRVDGTPSDHADFESGMSGWEPRRCEGFDFLLTGDPERPAGRITPLPALACPPLVDCPEACAIENNILLFVDRDDCQLSDRAETAAFSPAFAIGGSAHPDLDGDGGRLLLADVYSDGGSGLFDSGFTLCFHYWPLDANHCPYTPSAGAPGAGATFNWSPHGFRSCDYFTLGAGIHCRWDFLDDFTPNMPATADSVSLSFGMYSQCLSTPPCSPSDGTGPFIDNVRFGVFDPQSAMFAPTIDRFADNFPTTNAGFPLAATARLDGAFHMGEFDSRWVRPDTAAVRIGAPNTAVFLRFAVERGACQPNLDHPFFAAFPPSGPGSFPGGLLWHEARMDTARLHGTGQNSPGAYMTCFHESDARNGTFWAGAPPAYEPCDDILPDGLFTAGTTVYYFFEARDATTGQVTGTFPFVPGPRPVRTTPGDQEFWLQSNVLPALAPDCTGQFAHSLLVINDYTTRGVPGRGTVERERLVSTLASLGLEFDVYDVVATNYVSCYDGIGRREDRTLQQPRPPFNGATNLMLDNYDCIWYTSGLTYNGTLSDMRTLSSIGGHPSQDQQKLETWLGGCTAGDNRLLVLEGTGWAGDINANTVNGPSFLASRGIAVLGRDYPQEFAAGDLRRCARLAGTALAPDFAAEVFGSGCPDDIPINVYAATSGGEAVAYFLESLEDGFDPVNCPDDVPRPAWQAVVRKTNPSHTCEKSVGMSFSFAELLPPNCVEQCLFDDYVINGSNAELVIDLFQWAGQPINADPIGVGAGAAPRFVNALAGAAPNPAYRGAGIRYSIAGRGRVALRIYDAQGRLVRALVEAIQAPASAGYEVVWDGRNDAGRRVGAGVYLIELRAPGYTAARKLVLLD